MNMMTMTADSIGATLETAVPEIYVVIAKNSVVGMDGAGIADLLGCTTQEIQEIQNDQTYKDVRLLLAAEYARAKVELDFTYNSIEEQALKNLAKRVPFENDTETLLRIISVTNKAIRRSEPMAGKVLDPANGGARIPLTLTSRIVKRLNANGDQEVEETKQISVTNGSAENPSFDDIDSLLGVSRRPQIANMKIQTHEPDFDVDDIEFIRK